MLGRILRQVDKYLTLFENWTLFITVMVGLISLFANVILRYGFNYALAWSEELIRQIIIYTTFIGCTTAVKNRNMITIDALPQMVPRLKVPLAFVSHAATLLFSFLITYLGWQMVAQQFATNQESVIMKIPFFLLYALLPLMGVTMFARTIQVIYEDIQTKVLRKDDAGG